MFSPSVIDNVAGFVPICALTGFIVIIEPTIDIHVGFTVNVIITKAPSGSVADGSKYVVGRPP